MSDQLDFSRTEQIIQQAKVNRVKYLKEIGGAATLKVAGLALLLAAVTIVPWRLAVTHLHLL